MSVCKFQHARGRYFLHEHPAGATSWKETSVREVRTLPGAMTSTFDQCCYGLTSPYEGKPNNKITRLLHNIPAIHAEFGDRYCMCSVRHQQIIGSIQRLSLSRYCQVYSPKLCKAMVRQIAVQLLAGGADSSGGSAPAAESGSGRRRKRSDPEVAPVDQVDSRGEIRRRTRRTQDS